MLSYFNFHFVIIFSEGVRNMLASEEYSRFSILKGKVYNFIVMDPVGKDFSIIQGRNGGTFSDKTIALFAIQALEILERVHNKGITHRDLKPDNFRLRLNGDGIVLSSNL